MTKPCQPAHNKLTERITPSASGRAAKESVEQFLARGGIIEVLDDGARGRLDAGHLFERRAGDGSKLRLSGR